MKLLKIKFISIIILIFFVTCSLLFVFCGYGYKKIAITYAKRYNVEVELVIATIKVESNFNKNSLSPKGAIGLMQILPTTADYINDKLNYSTEIDLYNPKTNIEFGTYYLSYLLDKFKSEDIAICAYNAGEGTVIKWGLTKGFSTNKIKYKETLQYYKKVKFYKKLYGIVNYDKQ